MPSINAKHSGTSPGLAYGVTGKSGSLSPIRGQKRKFIGKKKSIVYNSRDSPTSAKIPVNLTAGVYPEDMGTYSVVARNLGGEARTSCHLRVDGIEPSQAARSMAKPGHAPVIKMGLKSQEVKEGKRAKLDCTVTAHPPPEVSRVVNKSKML